LRFELRVTKADAFSISQEQMMELMSLISKIDMSELNNKRYAFVSEWFCFRLKPHQMIPDTHTTIPAWHNREQESRHCLQLSVVYYLPFEFTFRMLNTDDEKFNR